MKSKIKEAKNTKKQEKEIENIIKFTAKEVVQELKKEKVLRRDSLSYFQKTEKLLYSYNDLIIAVDQKEKDIEFIKSNGLPSKSKSVVIYSSHSRNSESDQYVELLEGIKLAKERTERLVAKIERALDSIRDDQYFFIIQAKYFDKKMNAEIVEEYNISERTVRRHKNRLVNKLQLLLFGADAFDGVIDL